MRTIEEIHGLKNQGYSQEDGCILILKTDAHPNVEMIYQKLNPIILQ